MSAASIFEIAVKRALEKLAVPSDFLDHVRATRFDSLPVSWEHAWAAGALPLHHRDPFDRILVAQAQVEGLTLVTADADIARYDVAILAA